MFFGSLGPGYIPIFLSSNGGLSSQNLRRISSVGAGVLIGSALCVVIPEGIYKLFEAKEPSFDDLKRQQRSAEEENVHDHEHGFDRSRLKYIGSSLAAGFLFMLLVDKMNASSHTHSHSHEKKDLRERDSKTDNENASMLHTARSSGEETKTRESKPQSTLSLGLIVHAAVDGIAVGSLAASEASGTTEFFVFIALMLHKAPAAFGLSAVLQQSHSKAIVAKQLLIFSLAAPIAAIGSYIFLNMSMLFTSVGTISELDEYNRGIRTGICLLFSAGTFLYVSTMHILPELGLSEGLGSLVNALSWIETILLSCGIILAALASFDHNH